MHKTQAQSSRSDKCLLSILRASDKLSNEHQLDNVLCAIPQHETSFPADRKTSVVDGFRKLGRYVTLGPCLLRFARKFAVFQTIVVRPVEAHPTAPKGFQTGSVGTVPGGLLRRYINHRTRARKATIEQFEHRLGAKLADIQADLQRKSALRKTIHAEIQLLFHCEQKSEVRLKPRVICASKNACYLCNLFLSLHDQFYTPKTHGRLYPQWTLPDLVALSIPATRLQELDELYNRFHALIEQQILSCLETASLSRSFDNESRILNVRSLTASEASAIPGSANVHVSDEAKGLSGSSSHNSVVSLMPPNNHLKDESLLANSPLASTSSIQERVNGAASCQSSSSSSTIQNPAQRSTPPTSEIVERLSKAPEPTASVMPEPIQLIPGHPVRSFISASAPPTRFHTSRIRAELSYEYALSIASTDSLEQQDSDVVGAKRGVQVCAVWLSGEDTKTTTGRPGDIDLAADWASKKLDGVLLDRDGLLLRKGEDVLKLIIEDS